MCTGSLCSLTVSDSGCPLVPSVRVLQGPGDKQMVIQDTDTSFPWEKLTLWLCVVCGVFCRLCALGGGGEGKTMRPHPSAVLHFSPSPAQDVLSLPESPGMSHSLAAPGGLRLFQERRRGGTAT